MFKQCFKFILPSSCFRGDSLQSRIPPGFYIGTIVALKGNKAIIVISSRFYEALDLSVAGLRVGDPVYVLRQEQKDIVTAPGQIATTEVACQVLYVRANYVVVKGEEEKLLVLPWEYREDQEAPRTVILRRDGETLEIKETKRKVIPEENSLIPDVSSLTSLIDAQHTSAPSSIPQATFGVAQYRSYGSLTDCESDPIQISPLALPEVPSPHTEETPLSRNSKVEEIPRFPDSEKMALTAVQGLEAGICRKVKEVAEKWRYCGEGKIGGLMAISVGWLEVLTSQRSAEEDFDRFLSSLYEYHPSAACLSTVIEELQLTRSLSVLRSFLTTDEALEALEMQSYRLLSKPDSETIPDTTTASDTSPKGGLDLQAAADKTQARVHIMQICKEKMDESWYLPETESLPTIHLVRLEQSHFLLCPDAYF